jgi:hypothetical protein
MITLRGKIDYEMLMAYRHEQVHFFLHLRGAESRGGQTIWVLGPVADGANLGVLFYGSVCHPGYQLRWCLGKLLHPMALPNNNILTSKPSLQTFGIIESVSGFLKILLVVGTTILMYVIAGRGLYRTKNEI